MPEALMEYNSTHTFAINQNHDYRNCCDNKTESLKPTGKFIPWLKTQLQNRHAIIITICANAANNFLLAPLLATKELERANSYLHLNDNYLSTVSHGLKRLILSELLGIRTNELLFDCIAKGKPVCTNKQALDFNISHSQEWAAIVVSQNAQVGVDIEFPRAIDYSAFAESILTSEEYREFKHRNYEAHFFLERWSQKEAISKACGLGFFLDFKKINTRGINKILVDATHYYFYSLKFLAGCISVATTVEQKKIHVISFEQIKHEFISCQTIMPCKL